MALCLKSAYATVNAMFLKVENLKKTYSRGRHHVEALKGVTFEIKRGQFTSIMGPSGSGKSTLLHMLGGLDRATTGLVSIGGEEIQKFSDDELSKFRRRRLGFIFQFFNLLPTLTALENVALPLLLDGMKLKNIEVKATELLAMMGLESRLSHKPDQLSGGEMQRVAIARALITDPLLILADEPTGNLDSKTGTKVLELLATLAREREQTIVMVTHDVNAASYADRLITMKDGLIESDQGRIQALKISLSQKPALDMEETPPAPVFAGRWGEIPRA
ncbi:MAG: ABC transporter ATP-binding protein [Bdellovibrionia bacterium]